MNEALRRSAAHVLVTDVEDVKLDEATVHHLRRVLRLRAGEPISVTDGVGAWRTGTFTGAGVEPGGGVIVEPAPDPPLTIAVAPPKGARAEWLVQKCTEVGVDRIVWLDAERSVVRWNGDRAEQHLVRFRRIATEAGLQSRRVWFPIIDGPVPASAVLPGAAAAEPGGRPVGAGDTTIAVGPEGGWSEAESELAGSHVSLGTNVLRVETAALVAVTLMVERR